ncbi:MAG: flagellar basal body protein, partial [Pseudomonadota bacterium]
MSISTALASAISGLNASSRQVQTISNNLANALTPGYGTRQVELSSGNSDIGGVRITGITRNVDEALLNDRRRADSALADSTTRAAFFADLEVTLGTPEDPQSLTARLAELEASLITASVRPEEETRLQSAVLRAGEVVSALNQASDRVQELRTEAEIRIQQDVTNANEYLRQLERLNTQIVDSRNRGTPAAGFEDQRSQVLDQLAEIVPLRVFKRDNGAIAIYSPTGAGLLDGSAAELSFTPNNVIVPQMTQGNGLLSGLEITGILVTTSGDFSPISGGKAELCRAA